MKKYTQTSVSLIIIRLLSKACLEICGLGFQKKTMQCKTAFCEVIPRLPNYLFMPWWSGTSKSEVRIGSNTGILKVLTWEICSHGGRSDPPQKLIFYRLRNIFNEVSLKINYNKGIFYSFPRKLFFIFFYEASIDLHPLF